MLMRPAVLPRRGLIAANTSVLHTSAQVIMPRLRMPVVSPRVESMLTLSLMSPTTAVRAGVVVAVT